ncbi:hypothetical protein JBO49_03215 [Serratia fonticola]|uniref:hypothetical protein n=1 Tax=Serratia fonticola TaxID=47917 RepID=UPI00192B2848|nr:hypothetical protein [Serratia fonticola]MBL5859622.1 hypothetical protein [Serratia fonticola]
MNFSQLPEFAQIKACELFSSKYFHCTNEADRLNLANEVQQAFVNLYTEKKPVADTASEVSTPNESRKAISDGQHLCDVLYDDRTGITVDIDDVHQNVTNALCSIPILAIPPKIKTILILEEQTKVIRGQLSDEQLVEWLRKLIIEIEQSLEIPEKIKRHEGHLNQNKEALTSKKAHLNTVII